MAESLIGGAALGAVFGELLKAVLETKEKAVMFKRTLVYLRSTLITIAPVIKEIEKHNNDLGRAKEELESLITKMEEGAKLVSKCSKIHRLNYVARVRYREQLEALVESLARFFIIDMQAQTARDQKETLIKVTRILSAVNKFPLATTTEDASPPNDENAGESNCSSEEDDTEVTSFDPMDIDEIDVLGTPPTENNATETSDAQEAMESLTNIAIAIAQSKAKEENIQRTEHLMRGKTYQPLFIPKKRFVRIRKNNKGGFSSEVKNTTPYEQLSLKTTLNWDSNSIMTSITHDLGQMKAKEENILGMKHLVRGKTYQPILTSKKRFVRIRKPNISGFNGKVKNSSPKESHYLKTPIDWKSKSTTISIVDEVEQSKAKEENNQRMKHLMREKSQEPLLTSKRRFVRIRKTKKDIFNHEIKKVTLDESPSFITTLEPLVAYCAICGTSIKQQNTTFHKEDCSYCNVCYNKQVRQKRLAYKFDIDNLLRASTEIEKGNHGITSYKATLEDGRTVVVKKLIDVKIGKREFEQHMEIVQKLLPEHPNVLPLRAYYHHNDENLLIYDSVAHDSFSKLLHGHDM